MRDLQPEEDPGHGRDQELKPGQVEIEMVPPTSYQALAEKTHALLDTINELRVNQLASPEQKMKFRELKQKLWEAMDKVENIVIDMGDTEITEGNEE